jgi:S-adenosyl-L-methionine hydrolase (adenosine-forming)
MPLLTLTSDIGTQDYLVGAAKAQLLQINAGFSVIDISHNIPPFNYSQAAYVCRNTIINFPAYTYHIVLVNLFEKKPEQLLLAFHNNQYILCADNGLLSMIFDEKPELVIGIPFYDKEEKNTLYFVKQAGAVINKLVNGEPIKNIGIEDTVYLEGQIVFIDNFENVIVNITRVLFEKERKGRNFKIVFKRDEIIEKLSTTYADVPEGEILAFFNTAGYLEIAINKGNAAGLLGLKSYSEKNQQLSGIMQNRLFYQTVRVYFE